MMEKKLDYFTKQHNLGCFFCFCFLFVDFHLGQYRRLGRAKRAVSRLRCWRAICAGATTSGRATAFCSKSAQSSLQPIPSASESACKLDEQQRQRVQAGFEGGRLQVGALRDTQDLEAGWRDTFAHGLATTAAVSYSKRLSRAIGLVEF